VTPAPDTPAKTIARDQNFVLFLNMSLEMSCLFLWKNSEGLQSKSRFFKNEHLEKNGIEVPFRKTKKPQIMHFVG